MQFFKNIFQSLYIQNLFFFLGLGVVGLFAMGFFIPIFFLLGKLGLFALCILLVFDILLLFNTNTGLSGERKLPEKLSNGDQNDIILHITNYYSFKIHCSIIDEIPEEFQVRDFVIHKDFGSKETSQVKYFLRPTFRGNISFGRLLCFVTSPLKLASRRFSFSEEATVPVYPSFIQMKKYDLLAFSQRLTQYGMKKVRRLGNTMEFEKIKDYVAGDDFRTVNWKATSKANKLMVNQYQDERSQNVYCIIDKGRVMKMPFDGLSLLDYAINSSLAISNVVLRKQDYVGMFSFSRRIDNRVVADRKPTHITRIMEALYNVKTDFFESDFGRLYADVRKNIPQRSLLLLFTNFETMDGLKRQLPYLKAMAKNHLLIIIFFQNTELEILVHKQTEDVQNIFDKVIAEKFAFEKKLIVHELKKYGIHSILSKPENLTIDTINKYLEIKSRGMI